MRLLNARGWALSKTRAVAKDMLRLAVGVAVTVTILALARPARAIVHASIVVDAQTGQVLSEYHPDEQTHPASLTKLMTLYLTFQRLADGRMTLDQQLYVSHHAAAQQPTKLDLRPGSTVSVRSCILGIVTHSANDAAVVLAENISGSEAHFAQLMNEETHRLGMTRTIFYNASGLPNPLQWTTARDMATLAEAIIHTFPQYYAFFDVRSFYFHERTFYSFDHLPEEYPGADGMKTGFIDSSGFNLVTSAVRDRHRLVGVVLGGATARARDLQMISLLNVSFAASSHPSLLVASTTVLQSRAIRRPVVDDHLSQIPVVHSQPRTGTWSIQLGYGFHTSWEAHHVLRDARLLAPTSLHRAHLLVIRLRNRRYRARFSGLNQEMAYAACSTLRRKRYTCVVLGHFPRRQREVASMATEKLAIGE